MKQYLWWHWQGNVADSYDHGGFSLWEDSEKGTLFSPLTNRKDSYFWIGINSKLGLGLLLCVCVCVCVYACMLSLFSHVWLCATLWTIACQAPLSTGFSRQEYWSRLPFPSPRKTIFMTVWTFVGKVMSLIFNTWSRFVIAFLARSNHLLILGCSHHLQKF